MKRNIAEFPVLIKRVAHLGITDVELRYLKIYGTEFQNESLLETSDELDTIFADSQSVASAHGVNLVLPSRAVGVETGCSQPFDMLFIRHDGEVFGCCSAAFKGSIFNETIGHLMHQSIRSCWNSNQMRRLRRGLLKTGALCSQCRLCAFRIQSCESQYRIMDSNTSQQPDSLIESTLKG